MQILLAVILPLIGGITAIICTIAALKNMPLTAEMKIKRIKQEIKSLLTHELSIALWLTLKIRRFTPQNIGEVLSIHSKSNKFKRKRWVKHIRVAIRELEAEGYDLFIETGNAPPEAIRRYNQLIIEQAYKIDPQKGEKLAQEYNVKIPTHWKK